MIKTRYLQVLFILLLFLSSVGLRLIISLLGHNNDTESWLTVGKIISEGKIVYVHTQWYNYGPIWSYILGFVTSMLSYFQIVRDLYFHFIVVGFLSAVDVVIALLLMRLWGIVPGILFIMNPISILITGFHSQFDNLAVLIGLAAWIFLEKFLKQKIFFLLFISAFLLGLSLMTKHILFFLPIWVALILWWKNVGIKRIVLYVIITYVVFSAGFLVEILRNSEKELNVINGIKLHVFQYKGSYGHSAFLDMLSFFYPVVIYEWLFSWTPIFKGFQFLLIIFLTLSGYFFTKTSKNIRDIFPYYLLSVFAFSPIIADQYLAIPLVAAAVFYRNIPLVIFSIVGTIYLLAGPSANVSNLIPNGILLRMGELVVPLFPWSITYRPIDLHTQAWVILGLLFTIAGKFRMETPILLKKEFNVFGSVYRYVSSYSFYLLLLFFVVIHISLWLYSYHFLINRKVMNITVSKAIYGGSCKGLGVDAQMIVAKECNGNKKCDFLVNFDDPAPRCMKDFYVEWLCGTEAGYQLSSYIHIKPDAAGGKVVLNCPISKYYEYPKI